MKVSYLLLLLSVTLAVSVIALVPAASGGVTIVSPTPGQHFSAGQKLVLVVEAPSYAGQVVTVYVYNPAGVQVDVKNYEIPSNGVLNVTLLVWPNTTGGNYVPGNYTISVQVGVSAIAGVTVYWAPGIAYVVATVVNGQTGMPLGGVPVNVYNASNNVLLGSGITNQNGVANISVVAAPNHVETVKVVAMPSGYPPQGVTTTITGPGVYSVTIKVYPTALQLVPVEVIQSGKVTAESPQSIAVYQGVPVTMVVAVYYQGSPVSGATVNATVMYGNTTMQVAGTSIGNGMYNITFTIPSASTPLNGQVSVTATYNGIKSNTLLLSLNAIPNTQSEISVLNSTVTSLINTVNKLNDSLTNVQKQLANVTSQLNSVSSQMSSLSSQLSSLQGKLNTLSGQISQLQSQLSSSSNMIYAALGISIVALIIAIVALVYVLRKIS